MDDAPAPAPDKTRRRWLLWGCLTPLMLLVVLAVAGIATILVVRPGRRAEGLAARPRSQAGPTWVPDGWKLSPWASPPFTYDGPGRLDVYDPWGCKPGVAAPDPNKGVAISGKSVRCLPPFESTLVPSPRQLLVHTPPGYDDEQGSLPLVISLHGFGQRPAHGFTAFASFLDAAIASGRLPKVVTAFPDFSISGNGLDDLSTPYEDGGGSWGIDSNLGRFKTHFTAELLPFLLKTYRVSDAPGKTILLGGSMGGMMAINFMLDDPKRFPNVGAFYPPVDLRYSCNGDRLASYDPKCYQPLTSFDPARRMTNVGGLKGRLFTERMFLFPVMDSDKTPGPVWKEDLPMADRLRAASPVERLRDGQFDLRGAHIWFMVGDHDDFNINAHAPLLEPLAKKAGAELAPAEHIRPGGHDLDFFNAHVDEAIAWMAKRLAAAK